MEIMKNIAVELAPADITAKLHVDAGTSDATAVERMVARVRERMNPKAVYDVCYISARGEDTVEIGPATFKSRVLRVNLGEAHRAFPYIVTCGAEIDDAPAITEDPFERYWLEEIKKHVLGGAMAALREHIKEHYRPGKLSSMQPGSLEDWPITEQTTLFGLLGGQDNPAGVRLTDSFLMVPIKSVSGIFFPTEVDFASCQLCPREKCPGRRAPYEPHLWEKYDKLGV
ncbi:MAG TPA: vitamin B12 dependent-methionine synthase activation domain-containing protein [Candidatus Brocadiia bacterium]|nr:vitamin B12 dependent-methionine synthase activation domain-containing protein [Candidatus Brocadiia bacterium]